MSDDIERRVLDALAAGDHDRAVTDAIRTIGPEVLGFLHAVGADAGAANEAFSRFSVAVWRGLGGFAGRSSLRSWCYVLARRALYQVQRETHRVERMGTAELAAVVDEVRTETPIHLRTQTKNEIAALRAELDDDDRMLLTLRVDRQLPWRDLAIVFVHGEDPGDVPLDEAAVERTAATLRKRFERLKQRIRKLADRRGLGGDR